MPGGVPDEGAFEVRAVEPQPGRNGGEGSVIPQAASDGCVFLTSLGQGDFCHAEDLGVNPAKDKPVQSKPDIKLLEAEALGAALRYVAVADWFERLPFSRHAPQRERRAMDTFNRIEAELRQAGERLLRRAGHRELVLERALTEVAET